MLTVSTWREVKLTQPKVTLFATYVIQGDSPESCV